MQKLTITERAILANQNRILAHLDKDQTQYYNHLAEIAEYGYEGLYDQLFTSIHESTPNEVCDATDEILTMFRVINNTKESLTEKQIKDLNLTTLNFDGFDGNNDQHYHYAKFLIEKEGSYEELKGTNLNSHTSTSLGKYKRILKQYNEVMEQNNFVLDFNGLKKIIEAA